MAIELVVEKISAACAWGAAGPVCIVLWREVTVVDLRGFAAYGNLVSAKYPDGYAALSIVDARARAPSAEVRQAIVDLTKEGLNPNYQGSTTAVLGEGFFASVIRAALAGLSLVGGPGMPEHISKSVDEGAAYCANLVKADVAAVQVAVREFYAKATGPR